MPLASSVESWSHCSSARGHEVIGTSFTARDLDTLRALGATPVQADVFDADGLRQAVKTAAPDAVIHELTALGTEDRAANTRIRQEGTRNLVEAAKRAGVERFVVQRTRPRLAASTRKGAGRARSSGRHWAGRLAARRQQRPGTRPRLDTAAPVQHMSIASGDRSPSEAPKKSTEMLLDVTPPLSPRELRR